MSIWDNVKKFAQPYSDDEYDDYDDYDDDYEDIDEEPAPAPRASRKSARPSRPAARRSAPVREPAPQEDAEDDYEDAYETSFAAIPKAAPAPVAAPAAAPAPFAGKVVNMNKSSSQELVRFHPSCFQDSRKAAKDLIASKAVIVNLEDVDKETSRRMVDFLSGVVFALDGDVQKIAKSAYVFCPPNVFVTGGPEAVAAAAEEMV